jgi:hypothetical protein
MAPNPNYMAGEVDKRKNFTFTPIKHHSRANRKRRLVMHMAVNNLLARRRQKTGAPYWSSIQNSAWHARASKTGYCEIFKIYPRFFLQMKFRMFGQG